MSLREVTVPEVTVTESFLDIFDIILEEEKINISDSVANLFCLKIANREFRYNDLIDVLGDAIISYCLSKKEFDKLYSERRISYMDKRAKKLFRDHAVNDGELGEVILYSFLERHLNAPKILSKMKLKTSTNDYVKRADGIHLLKIDDNNYELIFGESKMYGNLTDGIRDAIKSISELVYREKNNIVDEIELLNSNISSEFAERNYEFIKKLIMPTRENEIDYDISFGVFVGFEIDFDQYKDLDKIMLKKSIKEKLKKDALNKIKYINEKISEYKLEDYNIYMYLLPFTNIENKRKAIMMELIS